MDLSIFITLEGMEKIQRRIAHLMNDERPEIIKAVATAREFGICLKMQNTRQPVRGSARWMVK